MVTSSEDERGRPTTRRRLMLGAGAAVAWPFVGGAVAAEAVTADEIRIGQTITLSGGRNAYGVAVLDGAKLLLDAPGARVHGRRVVLKTLDDEGRTAAAAANAKSLVDDGVLLLFGSLEGGPSTAVAEVAAKAGVPLFGPIAGSPGLRDPHQPLVFPVRAEHRDEFRALVAYGKRIGLTEIAFFHVDSEVGRQHLANLRRIADEAGARVVLPLPFNVAAADTQIPQLAAEIARAAPQLCLNHGSGSLYGELIKAVRKRAGRTQFYAVNSGSTQLARDLGDLAHGMVFSQVVPSPWEGKTAIAREYQAAARAAKPQPDFSYGALEGFMTAKALVAALRAAGPRPTRASFAAAMANFEADLGGVRVRYATGRHEGSRFVDLAIYSRDNRFIH